MKVEIDELPTYNGISSIGLVFRAQCIALVDFIQSYSTIYLDLQTML